ncbi:hypothetical protein MSG28_000319 [Choristoneura fumiferana]|uniref:Uncharacterized protein n=1 Tax=Choristoneura fumiferana TaxID=7141 RepID=A0ACC0K075_CHOFU|nr:hypothetical protein MSG28_000319 [Choristoneura fumiferana]
MLEPEEVDEGYFTPVARIQRGYYKTNSWLVKKAITSKLQVFVNKCLRRILGVYWPQTITNTRLWELTSQKPIGKEILLRKWRWIGHVLRRPHAHLAKQALEWQAAGSRRPGGPRITWRGSVDKEISLIGYQWRDLEATAQDRDAWKSLLRALCPC